MFSYFDKPTTTAGLIKKNTIKKKIKSKFEDWFESKFEDPLILPIL